MDLSLPDIWMLLFLNVITEHWYLLNCIYILCVFCFYCIIKYLNSGL